MAARRAVAFEQRRGCLLYTSVAREVKKQLDEVLAHFPPVEEALTDEERFTAALALTAALPERVFTCLLYTSRCV